MFFLTTEDNMQAANDNQKQDDEFFQEFATLVRQCEEVRKQQKGE